MTATEFFEGAYKILVGLTPIILGYLAYLQQRAGKQQVATAKAAGVAADAAQEVSADAKVAATEAKALAATVIADGEKRVEVEEKRDVIIGKIHDDVNSAKTELERQNKALVRLAESKGAEVPAGLRAKDTRGPE